jgi:outer membrane protein assembly factor BamB
MVRRERPEPAPAVPDARLINFGVTILAKSDTRQSLLVPPVVSAENIFMVRSYKNMRVGSVEIWDSRSGRLRTTVRKMAGFVSRPAVGADGRTLYAADVKGRVFLIDVPAAKVLRSAKLGERVTSQLVLAPAEKERPAALLAGTVSGRMYCLDAKTLKKLWVNEDAAGAVPSRSLVAGGCIVYGAWDGHLHCLDAATGERVWSWTENDNFYYSPAGCVPATDGTNVFVCCPDGYVSAVDLATGKTVWRENHGAWESLGLSEDRKRLFVKSVRDEFSVVDAGSGRLLRKTEPAQGETDIIPTVPVESRGRIVFGAKNGHVYMICEEGGLRPLLYLGAAPVISVERVGEDTFLAPLTWTGRS